MGSFSVPPGALLANQYTVLQPLGEGGMGVVYVVEQVSTGAKRALKLLRPEMLGDARTKERFAQEARIGTSIQSDHVVQVLDANVDDRGRPFIVMELLSGESLAAAVTRKRHFSAKDLIEVFRQLCHALDAAHSVSVVHRDIKPENIFLSKSRSAGFTFMVKVLDFGIAKVVAEANRNRTQSIGTPNWMPPEQMSANPVIAPATDIWALGLVAFYMLTGHEYWLAANQEDESTAAVLREVCIDPLVTASARAQQLGVGDRVPPGFDEWFSRCVNRDASARFPNAETACSEFAGIVDGWKSVGDPTVGGPSSSRELYGRATPPGQGGSGQVGASGRISQPQLPPVRDSNPNLLGSPSGALGTSRTQQSDGSAVVSATGAKPQKTPIGIILGGVAIAIAGVVAVGTWAVGRNGKSNTEASASASAEPKAAPGAASAAQIPNGTILLRLHGSNTIGAELAPALAEAFFKKRGASDVRMIRQLEQETTTIVGTLSGESAPSKIVVVAKGSGTAFKGLDSALCDIGMSSRRIKDDEFTKLAGLGNMRSSAAEHVVGIDGIAVVVHRSNPVSTITTAELSGLFSGKITDWSQIKGGAAGPVHLMSRDDKSGTYDTFKSVILGEEKLLKTAKRYEDSAKLSDDVAADPAAIGFVGLPYVRTTKALAVAEGAGRALLPNVLTIRTEDYPISRRLFLYTGTNPPQLVSNFVDFAEGGDGQRIVQQMGFVGLIYGSGSETDQISAGACAGCPGEYVAVTKGATRLPLNFRFQSGSTDLDNRAQKDIDRLLEVFADAERKSKQLTLLGFADNRGTPDSNRDLSVKRANILADALRLRGLNPAVVKGMGDLMPVATNDTDYGREKNRRVEVWLR